MRNLITAALAVAIAIPAHAAPTNIPAVQSTMTYSRTATGASGYGNYARVTSTVVYDPATDSYTVRDTGSLTTKSTFSPANIDTAASSAAFTVYKKTGPGSTETFRKLNAGAGNPLIALNYVTYGQWRRTATTSGTTNVNDTYVVFGSKTMTRPTTGTGSYSTVLDGTFVNRLGAYAVTGTGSLTANFGGGTIAYDATANGAREGGGTGISFGAMTGTGLISSRSGGFSGAGAVNASGYALDVMGNFYGPTAQEIGGTFRLRGNGGNGTGAIVGN